MSDQGWYKFSAKVEIATLITDQGDFFNLEGDGTVSYRILELRVFQRGSVSLLLDTILLRRGVITAAAGTAVTEYEYTTSGPAPTVVARSLPTTDVASTDWEYIMGWNLLQEAVDLPIPGLWIPCSGAQDFGISRLGAVAHTNVGVQVVWEEYLGG